MIGQQIKTDKSYFDNYKGGDTSQWIISHSDICKIDPIMGGHPKSFYKHMLEGTSISTPSMDRGDLLHLWIQKKEKFVISDLSKPTGKLAEIGEAFYNLYILENYKVDNGFSAYCSKEYTIDMSDLFTYHTMFETINGRKANEDEIKLFIYAFRYCREVIVKYNSNHKEPTVLKDFNPGGLPYIKFLKEASGKVILTPQDRDILTNCYESVRNHPFANKLLFEMKGEHEEEIYWTEEANNGLTINRRAKIDKYIIDFTNKILIIIDLKTTSYPVTQFAIGENCSYKKYNYGRQLVSYAKGIFKSKGINNPFIDWDIQLYNVVVQTNNEYPTVVYRTDIYLTNHYVDLAKLVDKIADHIKLNNWEITIPEIQQGYVSIQ